MEIQRLPEDVIDKIAAGEVVERPAHMVKELLENSVDAGAKNISVSVSEGGRNVRVMDDGEGIARDQLNAALARHCTSKISSFSDLWRLNSFGFRGEALATISAVSRMTLSSRTLSEPNGFGVTSDFGKISNVQPAAVNSGTTVDVSELFENVPARLKFMKSPAAEVAQIRTVIQALALSQPEVEISLSVNGKWDIVYSKSKNLLNRCEQVLEISPLFESAADYGSYQAHVVFSAPSEVRGNSRGIWLFVQNRWVQDRGLQAAVMDAYRGLLMHGEFPNVVVHLMADAQEVDVNVHPTKSQVRFRDPKAAFRAVHHALRSGIERAPWNAEPIIELEPQPQEFAAPEFENIFVKPTLASPMVSYGEKTQVEIQKRNWSKLQILGQARATYILTESDADFVLIDQHAAHERVLYERLMQSWKNTPEDIQNFLLPLTVALPSDQVESALVLKDEFAKLGIEMDQFSEDAVIIRAAPAWLSETALTKTLQKTAEEITSLGGSFAIEKLQREVSASLACHSAVRAGQRMTAEEMQQLLVQMEEFAFSGYCPHGRPVSVEIPWTKLERDFGRLV